MASDALRQLSINLAKGNTGTDPVNTKVRNLDTGSIDNDGGTSAFDSGLNKALTGYVKTLGTGPDTKTIMEKFAERAKLTKEGGVAERSLLDNNYGDKISEQLDSNAEAWTGASEGRSGFATKTAAVQYLEKSGTRRVLDLEKQRDSLILQSKVAEAGRLDTLIGEEQKAITDARKNWLEELFGLAGESRAQSEEKRAQEQEKRNALAFETPEEARTRDLVASEAQARMEGVRTLATTAPDAGILSTDSYDTAITKYRNSATYKRDQKRGELEIQQLEANISNTRSLISDRNAKTPGSTTTQGVYSSDLDYMIGAAGALAAQGGKYNLEYFNSRMAKARNDADKINIIADTALGSLPADKKKDFQNQSAAVAEIDQAIKLLDEGIKTGVYNSATQYLYNVVGKDFDPKLARINQHITSAIQPYRSSITGAAWGSQEDAEYQSLFGSTKYSPTELRQRLQGVKEIMLRKTASAVNSQINPLGGLPDIITPNVSGLNMSVAPAGMFNDNDL